MGQLSLLTALEIFTNPGDLEIKIGRDLSSGKFSLGIFRGPGHNFKAMVTWDPFAETSQVAIEAVEEILTISRREITKQFRDKKSLPSEFLNPSGKKIDQTKVLSPEVIAWILAELRQKQVASTYEHPLFKRKKTKS